MKNKTKLRKQAVRDGNLFVKLQDLLDDENMKEMDRMADKLGIQRCSDYLREKHSEEEARASGLCTCQK